MGGIADEDYFALARFKSNGALDTTFSGDGRLTTDFGGDESTIRDLAVQPDGRIVAVGAREVLKEPEFDYRSSHFALARYTPSGALDRSFSVDGKAVIKPFGGDRDYANAVALQPTGRIVVAGSAFNPASRSEDFAVLRYRPDGTLDTTFAGDGKRPLDINQKRGRDEATDLAIRADGKVLVAGSSRNPDSRAHPGYDQAFALASFNPTAALIRPSPATATSPPISSVSSEMRRTTPARRPAGSRFDATTGSCSRGRSTPTQRGR